ncbi:MAG: prenyltransferase [Nitrososphaerales archaeon]
MAFKIVLRISLSRLNVWMRIVRAPFLLLVIIFTPVTLAMAWNRGYFNPLDAVLTFIGVLCLHASANTFNNYFDYKSGIDIVTTPTPFSGGSKVLPNKELKPESALKLASGLLAIGSVIGIYFSFIKFEFTSHGWVIMVLLLISAISIYFYSTKFASWGLGELFVGSNFGPLLSMGVYYVQAGTISLEPILIGTVLGIFTAGVLYINEFPDYDADKSKGRYHIIVRLGKERATKGFKVLMFSAYALIILGVITQITPFITLVGLATLPLAIKASKILDKNYNSPMALIPGMASTIMCTLLTGIILLIAYLINGFFL